MYPDLNDPDFNSKIAAKREFKDQQYDGTVHTNIEEEANNACNSDFEILPHQQFVKNFMSLDTPYNSLLLYHELGTGKTCSAIGITEEMRTYMAQTGVLKKIMIIASPNVQDNFRNQLFNPNKLEKLKNGAWNLNTCVGNTLLKQINPTQIEGLSREQIIKSINSLINKYYRFLGYDSVALYSDSEIKNVARREMRKQKREGKEVDLSFLDHVQDDLPEILDLEPIRETDTEKVKNQKKRVIQKLKEKFDYRLIVVDEFHNMVARRENTKNNAVRILLQIVRYCKYTRLVLLSATPLYNSQEEIIWLTNIMNLNDKRAVITERQVFDKNGDFVEERKNSKGIVIQESGEDLLRRKLTGYVSYVRGENPYTFPFRVYPKEFASKDNLLNGYPTKQFNGASMTYEPKKYVLDNVYINQIGEYQARVYNAIVQKMKKDPLFSKKTSFNFRELSEPLSVLNMVYPSEEMDNSSEDFSGVTAVLHGKKGLENVMTYERVTQPYEQILNFEYKPSILEKHGKIFELGNIGKFSCKIESICKAIQNSTGIVLIYSRYLEGGLLPMALALEEMGFSRYSYSSHVRPFLKSSSDRPLLNPLTMKKKEPKDEFTAKYAMITGTKLFSHNNDLDLELIMNSSNKDGRHVKVVMISEAGSEGLDFKCIRQVHILDPWYNMSRIEQTIGRAVRNKSHCALPLKQRNVEIYMHGTMHETDVETADMYMYRLAEYKAIQIGQITRIMKECAVDCLLNEKQNNFTEENMNAELEIELSSNNKKIKYNVGDKAFSSKCDYMEQCELTCKGVKKEGVENTTYNMFHISQNHERIAKRVRQLFKDRALYSLKDLITDIQATKTYPLEEIYYSISQFLKNKLEWVVYKDKVGHLVLHNDMYMFQPDDVKDTHASMFERTTPLYKVPKDVIVNLKEEPKPKEEIPKKKTIVLNPPKKSLLNAPEPVPSALGKMLNTSKSRGAAKTYAVLMKEMQELLVFWKKDITQYIKEFGGKTKSKEISHVGIRVLHFLKHIHKVSFEVTMFHLITHVLDTTVFLDKMSYVYGLFTSPSDFEKELTTTFDTIENVIYSYFRKRMMRPSNKDYYVLYITNGNTNEMMVFKNDQWNPGLPTEKEHPEVVKWIETMFEKSAQILSKVIAEGEKLGNIKESMIGFIGLNKSGSEKDGYIFKLKNMLQVRNALGASCEQASKEITFQRFNELKEFLDRSDENYVNDVSSDKMYIEIGDGKLAIIRHHICMLYEMFLRILDNKNIWFLGPEEAIYSKVSSLTIQSSIIDGQQVFDILKK